MSLDSQVVAARIHLRVCELRLPAAVTAVQLARGKTSSRPAPRPVASPATAAWRYPSPPAPKRISLEWEQRETFLKSAGYGQQKHSASAKKRTTPRSRS